jgi:hypothetical protein
MTIFFLFLTLLRVLKWGLLLKEWRDLSTTGHSISLGGGGGGDSSGHSYTHRIQYRSNYLQYDVLIATSGTVVILPETDSIQIYSEIMYQWHAGGVIFP